MAALEQTGGTEGTAIASTGTWAGGAVGWGWLCLVCHESKKSGRGVREGEEVKRRKNTETCCILCVEVCAGVNRDNKDWSRYRQR